MKLVFPLQPLHKLYVKRAAIQMYIIVIYFIFFSYCYINNANCLYKGERDKGTATLTYKALEEARTTLLKPENGNRDDVMDIVVVITDGATNPGKCIYTYV